MSLPNSVSFIILISLLRYAKLVARVILKRPSSEVAWAYQELDVYSTESHEFPALWPSPSLVPPTPSLPAGSQNRLPVVEFGDFVRLNLCEDEGAALCAICLQEIERRHEIREPTKTALFEGEEERSSVGNPWTSETNTYFFRDF
ncbi:hypothetical protein BT93_D2078 [Corymbia citriodora subsp. variegata]|nr:hypothetical protein BT93_D2078 [Corymbia citriodora subsp. variegata]